MAKFDHCGSSAMVHSSYEGDYMVQDKEFVKIFKKGRSRTDEDELVAAIRLERGCSVKKADKDK